MSEIGALFRHLAQALQLDAALDARTAGILVAVVGVAALAAAVVISTSRALPGLVAADPTGAPVRPHRIGDLARLRSQSDPDAPGRVRPRAPGRGRAAA